MKSKLAIFVLVVVCGGCSDESMVCSLPSDCFKGEICTKHECVPAPIDSNNSNNSTPNNSTPDNSNNLNNSTPNNSNNSTPNNSTNLSCLTDGVSGGECIKDHSDLFSGISSGCPTNADFVEMNETRSLRMCAIESRDLFTQKYFRCANPFTPTQSCDRTAFRVHVSIDDRSCDEPNEDIKCEDLPNGGLKVTAIVTPGNTLHDGIFFVGIASPWSSI